MAWFHVNGRLVPDEEAVLHVNDRAVLFGDGAYETVRTYDFRVFRFDQHMARMRSTLDGLDMDLGVTDDGMLRRVDELVRANGDPDARIRITVTGGRHEGPIRLKRPNPPSVVLASSPVVTPTEAQYREGVDLVLSLYTVPHDNPLARIKAVPRLVHLMAKEDALQAGAYDSIFRDDRGCLLEGTMTNIFLVVDGTLCTPALDGALLAGVTRDLVLELARDAGVPVHEGDVPVDDAPRASEAFLTSTTIELLPVRRFDGHDIGAPGPVRRDLHRRYREVVSRETGVTLSVPAGA